MTEIALSFPKRAYVRIALGVVPLALSVVVFWLSYLSMTGQADEYGRMELSNHVMSLVLCVGVGVASACGIFALRERGARVTWDEHGVTEWLGAGPRVAIPWSDAKVSRTHVVVRDRGRGYADGGLEQLEDSRGRRITIASTIQGIPGWLLRRRCEGTTGAIPQLAKLPAGGGVRDDERNSRSISWLTWIARLGYLPLLLMCADLPSRDFSLQDPALVILMIVTPALLLRVLRPVAEVARLARQARHLSGARRVEIVDNEGSYVTAREADGRPLTFDVAPLQHDDALLALRRGPVWIVAPAPIPGGDSTQAPYRHDDPKPAPIQVARLEHDGIRRARAALIVAVLVEIAARTAFAFYPPIACVLIHSADEAFRGARTEGLGPSLRAQSPGGGAAS